MHRNTSRCIRNDYEKAMQQKQVSQLPVELSHPQKQDMNFLECTYTKEPNIDMSTHLLERKSPVQRGLKDQQDNERKKTKLMTLMKAYT